MEIFLSDIPEGGLPVSGTIAPSFFGLDERDSIRPAGDLAYDLTVYRFDDVVVLSGTVSGDFELQCVTCLDFFPYKASFPSWQSEIEIEAGMASFDPRESLRDEILLALPVTPHCNDSPDRPDCPRTELLSRLQERDAEKEAAEEESRNERVWGALDRFEEKP